MASGAKTARPVLDGLLSRLRSGDTLVIWKLDRLGRNLKHLINLTNELMEREIGLISLNDPIDTTTPQGRLVFNIFAALAEIRRVDGRRSERVTLTDRPHDNLPAGQPRRQVPDAYCNGGGRQPAYLGRSRLGAARTAAPQPGVHQRRARGILPL